MHLVLVHGLWQKVKANEWLVTNPIVAKGEVAFIRATIAHQIAVAERAQLQPDTPFVPPAVSTSGTGNWVGKYPLFNPCNC